MVTTKKHSGGSGHIGIRKIKPPGPIVVPPMKGHDRNQIAIDGINNGEMEKVRGVFILSTPGVKALNAVFSGIPYLRKLAAHRRRIKKELAKKDRIFTKTHKPVKTGWNNKPYIPATSTKPKRKYEELLMVNCAGCKKVLLGESEEETRRVAKERNMACVSSLPGPVAMRLHGAPFCTECTKHHKERHRNG